MVNLKILNILKYKLVRLIERNPTLNLLVYNNIKYLKFLLPHEKDYLGMKKICKNSMDEVIVDIGANLGISTMGFRQMGFRNKIYIFEPNPEIFKKHLIPIKKKYKNIFLKNFALGHKNTNEDLFIPYYENEAINYFGSFDKQYIYNSVKMTFPNIISKVKLKKKKIKINKLNNLPKLLKTQVVQDLKNITSKKKILQI